MSYRFVSQRKSGDENPGELIVNEQHRFTKMGHSKDRNTLWYGCSCREVNGIFCPAKIWLGRGNAEEEENEENGELMATNWLVVKLIGAHTHPAQQANIIVQSATLEMIKRAVQEPDKGATKIRNDVLNDLRKEYKDSPEFLGEIIQEFGNLESLDKKIWRARAKTEGKQPDNRDDFDPSQYYREHEGEDVVVIDSNNVEDLPEGWKNALKRPVDTEDESGRRWKNATNNLFEYEREGEKEEDEEGDEEDVEEQGKIKRVLIFTTNTLIKAFEESDGKASVDGTFFVTPKLWKQTFVLSIKVGGLWIPVAYGLLPDKEETSYLAFHFMLKRKLKNNNIKINLVSMMMDYEINVQRAAVTIWPELEIHGCFFHFSCLFYKRVRIRGMQERYNADVDFRSFVKSAVGIAHIPKEDIEAAVEVLRRFKFDDDEVLEFQEYLVNYIEDYWIILYILYYKFIETE